MIASGIVTLAGFTLQHSKSLLQTIENFQSSKRVVLCIRVNSVSKKCRRWDACASILSSHHRISAGLSIPEPSSLPYSPVDSAQLFFAEPPNMSYEMPIRKLSNLIPPESQQLCQPEKQTPSFLDPSMSFNVVRDYGGYTVLLAIMAPRLPSHMMTQMIKPWEHTGLRLGATLVETTARKVCLMLIVAMNTHLQQLRKQTKSCKRATVIS